MNRKLTFRLFQIPYLNQAIKETSLVTFPDTSRRISTQRHVLVSLFHGLSKNIVVGVSSSPYCHATSMSACTGQGQQTNPLCGHYYTSSRSIFTSSTAVRPLLSWTYFGCGLLRIHDQCVVRFS